MDNIILNGMLKDFAIKHELQDDSLSIQFEKFTNYCLLKTDYYDSFDFDKIGTGECVGVDGVAVIIGGVIVNEQEDARTLTRGNFDAKFVFSQAKTSSKFDLGDFLKFMGIIKTFFTAPIEEIPIELRKAYSIKEIIYERASKLNSLPTVELAYVHSGMSKSIDTTINSMIEAQMEGIRSLPYKFSLVTYQIHDGDSIARLYRETQNDVQREIPFQRHVVLPPIKGTRSAYLGVVKCKDFVDITKKGNGELNKGLFFENVRDYLGNKNQVNEDIQKTIRNDDEKDRFAILNNGITIIAKKVTPSGDLFKLSRFQVVNGCQTSHVLFNNYNLLSDDMFLTVKLIETEDVDLSGKVIATTNSQSQVTKEAFATIRPYHRSLEDYFNAMRSTGYQYYYERRPHQYDNMENITQNEIVSAPNLIKSFVSVVLEEPHKVHYYYGTLLSEYNQQQTTEIFNENDYPGIYFASHHIVSRTKTRITRTKDLGVWVFHLALLIKLRVAPELKKGISINDRKFLDIMKNIESNFDNAFTMAVDVLRDLKFTENNNRLPDATIKLVSEFKKRNIRSMQNTVKPSIPPTEKSENLGNGEYIGTVESINTEFNTCVVKHGPFSVEAKFKAGISLKLHAGSRVSFTIKNNQATIWI